MTNDPMGVMLKQWRLAKSVLCGWLWFSSCLLSDSCDRINADEVDDNFQVEFVRDIAPLLEKHCLRCHAVGNEKGGLSLSTSDHLLDNQYVTDGHPDQSELIAVISGGNDEPPKMPKDGKPLTIEQVSLFREWIASGAEWPAETILRPPLKSDDQSWSLQPLSDAPPPPVNESVSRELTLIDRFVVAKLQEHGLTLNSTADRRTLIRRVSYDLTGLPPSLDEVITFEQDTSVNAYEKVVDRLLASPRYGERWGRHWLDVIRFGESKGYEQNHIINSLWPFRDYVIRCFNEDKPYDRMVREHLAGDVIGKDVPEVEVGSAFLVCGPYDSVGNSDPVQAAQIRANTIDEIIRSTSGAFLGLTVGCARCHDHKFDPILQEDYYGLYATFAGVWHGERDVSTAKRRQTRAAKIRPLEEKKQQLVHERNNLLTSVLQRSKARLDKFQERWTRPAVSRQRTEDTFRPTRAKFVKLVVEGRENDPDSHSGYVIDEFEIWTHSSTPENVALASAGAVAQGSSRKAKDFADAYGAELVIDGRFGVRWVATGPELIIRLAKEFEINRVTFSSDRSGAAETSGVANFVCEYRVHTSLDGIVWTEIANSHDRKPMNERHRHKRLLELEMTSDERVSLDSLDQEIYLVNEAKAQIPTLPRWWVGKHEPAPGPFHVFIGGSPQRPGEVAIPASLRAFAKLTSPYELPSGVAEGQRRLALANWIVNPQNALTLRVLANRLWHYHFGTGIVDSPSDFGYMGGRPSHPQLLDWLAREIVRNQWQLKPLHKLIMMSAAYQQASHYRRHAVSVDSDNRLLWRFPPRRLTAEEIRDTILATAGSLDLRMGGPGFRLYHYWQDNVSTYVPKDAHEADTYRRMVYHHNARAARVDLVSDFDGPDCVFATPRRVETTTPLQALTMLNHRFTVDMAHLLAHRVKSEVGQEPMKQIERMFELAYGRQPDRRASEDCLQMLSAEGLVALCRVVLNTTELIYVQ